MMKNARLMEAIDQLASRRGERPLVQQEEEEEQQPRQMQQVQQQPQTNELLVEDVLTTSTEEEKSLCRASETTLSEASTEVTKVQSNVGDVASSNGPPTSGVGDDAVVADTALDGEKLVQPS
jgi:hypothetical protein